MINQIGPDQYEIPKIDAHEAETCGCCGPNAVRADDTMYAIRAGVGRVKTNKYAGKCVKCSARIEANAGLLVQINGKYGVSHKSGACSA